jgi:hypothetical protein
MIPVELLKEKPPRMRILGGLNGYIYGLFKRVLF